MNFINSSILADFEAQVQNVNNLINSSGLIESAYSLKSEWPFFPKMDFMAKYFGLIEK